MELLYSNILPLGTTDGQKTIIGCFNEQIEKSDHVEIAVGYISVASLEELDKIIEKHSISFIGLTIGMYYVEGMPERSYHKAVEINQKWKTAGIGEIRLVKSFKYHGKVYCFYKDGAPFSAIVGSANLSVIKPDAISRRQYETAVFTENETEISNISIHIDDLKSDVCSSNIGDLKKIPLIRERNTALNGIELVTSVPQSNVAFYEQQTPEVSFYLPLKVPKYERV